MKYEYDQLGALPHIIIVYPRKYLSGILEAIWFGCFCATFKENLGCLWEIPVECLFHAKAHHSHWQLSNVK